MKRTTVHFFSILFAAFAVGGLFFAVSAYAQGSDLGVESLAEAAGAPVTDIRIIIARIIRVVLGTLGFIFLGLVLYAGFLWMTAAGDIEKVEKAKRMLFQAVIGLVIMLSSFGIAQFVLSRLLQAAGYEQAALGGGASGAGAGGIGGISRSGFYVRSISPTGAVAIRNVVVRAFLTEEVDPASLQGAITVTNGDAVVAGAVSASGRMLQFAPLMPCPDPNADQKCFDADTAYQVTVKARSRAGRDLSCGGPFPRCDAKFTTGALVDVKAPTGVEITAPDDGQSVSVDAIVPVWVRAEDDVGVAAVTLSRDGEYAGDAVANPPISPFVGSIDWDPSGVPSGSHTLTARALDADDHASASPPVRVVVRPAYCFNGVVDGDEVGEDCGGACGACGGGACREPGECAGGLCQDGKCVDTPRIDDYSPRGASPGIFVTITGAFFGRTAGRVVFLGGPGADDDKEAAFCAPDAWSDSEITVITPVGFNPGPLRVVSSAGNGDDTNDARGPVLPPVTRSTTQGAPSICTVTPSRVKPGGRVTILGRGFVNQQPRDAIYWLIPGVREAFSPQPTEVWEEQRIVAVVPPFPLARASAARVQVRANGNVSNFKNVILLPPEAGERPTISDVAPASGPPGQYVTVRGANFGSVAGQVLFMRGADRAVGDTDFPRECTERFWSQTSITVKVPRAYSDRTPIARTAHQIKVVRNDRSESTTVPFAVNDAPLGPSICVIDPDNGPVGTSVDFIGERLGTIEGTVRWSEQKNASVIASWRDRAVRGARVPELSVTGPVAVVSGGVDSNPLAFAVGACRNDASCGEGRSCCADGICRADCAAVRPAGFFAYRFSTGDIPRVPVVVEEQVCNGATQSPSPWRGSRDACVNASVTVRFSELMDIPSIVAGGTEWVSCNTDDALRREQCGAAVPQGQAVGVGEWSPPGGGRGGSTVILSPPRDGLAANTWYRVTIHGAIQSVSGIFLDGDRDGAPGGEYVWYFRTRQDAAACNVDHVELSPESAAIAEQDGTVIYTAAPTAANCNVLQCSGYEWAWQSSFHGAVIENDPADPLVQCRRSVRGAAETPPDDPATITASLPAERKSDTGTLAINFLDPQIIASWPTCREACANAAVGATFNTAMDPESLNADTVQLYPCANESCRELGAPPAVFVMPQALRRAGRDITIGFELVAPAGGGLAPATDYRIIVRGGAAGVRSASGAFLAGANYGEDASWTFKTSGNAASCDLARVEISPPFASVRIVGDVVQYRAAGRGRPDACEASGQLLRESNFSWEWSAAAIPPSAPDALVATIDFSGNKDILPLSIVGRGGAIRSGPGCSAQCLNTGSVAGIAICGNEMVERGEDCDDGNTASGDGCSSRCLNEGTVAGAACGNGARDRGEDCDFGNRCSKTGVTCAIDADCGDPERGGFCAANGGRACTGSGARCSADADCGARGGRCAPTSFGGCSDTCEHLGSSAGGSACGTGAVGDGEDCDDGNTTSGDGCSAQCVNEGSRAGPYPVCGNGARENGEDCDDGNTTSGDGCSAQCVHEGTRTCVSNSDTNCCSNGGIPERGEDCDDGNRENGDGCSARCLREGSSARYGLSVATASYCGDGRIDEEPDRGGRNRGESCEFTPAAPPADSRADADAFVRAAFPVFDPAAPPARGFFATATAAATNLAGARVSGEAVFSLACSCTTDASCGAGPGVGCGIGSCCYARPEVIRDSFRPQESPDGACRNALFSARFTQIMDPASIIRNVQLVIDRTYLGVPACPRDRETILGPDWCLSPITGAISTRELDGKTEVLWSPREPLAGNTRYGLLILGAGAGAAGQPSGVTSVSGVSMSSYALHEVFTGADICSLDVARPSWSADEYRTSWLFSTAADNERDNTPATPAFDTIADRDKVAFGRALAARGGGRLEEIAPTDAYHWTWSWAPVAGFPVVDGAPKRIAPLVPSALGAIITVSTVGQPTAGSATITGTAAVDKNMLGTACAEDAACGRGRSCRDMDPGDGEDKRCVGESQSGSVIANVMICNNPWPARALDGSWEPYIDDTRPGRTGTHFSFSFCRDAGGSGTDDDLPAPSEEPVRIVHPEPGGGGFITDLLFPLTCPPGASCVPGDALGVRVLPNPGHLSALRWYGAQGFTGSPQETVLDGYDAVADGRTVYVAAANRVIDPVRLFTNTYIISYNEGGSDTLKTIFRSVLANWRFNTDFISENHSVCRVRVCVGNQTRVCTTDADCRAGAGAPEGDVCAPAKVCSADADCPIANKNICDAAKDKLQRDVRRWSDFRSIEAALERTFATNQHCSVSADRACFTDANCPGGETCVGSYPDLSAGTFIRGRSVSTWPSWQSALGNDLSTALPADPLNSMAACPDGADAATCWNAATGIYQCPSGSHVYQYRKDGPAYALESDFEFRVCQGNGRACAVDTDCRDGGAFFGPCVQNIWQGITAPVSHGGVNNQWTFGESCRGEPVGQAGSCGDGVVGAGEECEGATSRLVACARGGRNGYARESCAADCRFTPAAPEACAVGNCDDGVVQPPEVCDDGEQNGSYGRCSVGCTGYAERCGDGRVRAGMEVCDRGGYCARDPGKRCNARDTNGDRILDSPSCTAAEGPCVGGTIYNASEANSCALDCRTFGPYCGDRTVQSARGEECDGNSETISEGCDAVGGRPTAKNRSCGADCRWTRGGGRDLDGWGACIVQGTCGDGALQAPAEACDDGNRNDNDSCTNTCQRNICGDGLVNPGAEQCDDGANNVRPGDSARISELRAACAYGRTCNYCAAGCLIQSVSGGSCGDGTVQRGYEICEPSAARAGWQQVCLNDTSRVCSAAVACPGSNCYSYTPSSMCAADCSGACPPRYANEHLTWNERAVPGGNYLNQFTPSATFDNNNPFRYGLRIPACREFKPGGLNVAAMDFDIVSAPPLDVVFIVDLSQSMGGSRITDLKNALRDAVMGLFNGYFGEVKVGIASFSSSNRSVQYGVACAVDRDCGGGGRICRDSDPGPAVQNRCTGTLYAPNDNPKYQSASAVLEGPDSETALPSQYGQLLGRENRSELFTIIDNLEVHNSDYTAAGFARAKDILSSANSGDQRVVIYLSDGEAKCGTPLAAGTTAGSFNPSDETTPVCYQDLNDSRIATVTERLATKTAGEVKKIQLGSRNCAISGSVCSRDSDCSRRGDFCSGVKIYSVAFTGNAATQTRIRERSSECNAPTYSGYTAAAGYANWAVGCQTSPPAAQYAYVSSGSRTIQQLFTDIIKSILAFTVVTTKNRSSFTQDITSLPPWRSAPIRFPNTVVCDQDAAVPGVQAAPQDVDITLTTRIPGVAIRASNASLALCRP